MISYKKLDLKEKKLLVLLVYKNFFKFHRLIKNSYNKLIYKKGYDLILSLKFIKFNKSLKEKENKIFKNQLILEYFFNGIIYFLLIINWL